MKPPRAMVLAVRGRPDRERRCMPRRRLHRFVFAAAGLYNLAWGTYSALDPQWFFRAVGMELATHPEVFACLGMCIALYGVLYLDVARRPERGRLIAAIGLLGKVLGPAGALVLIAEGRWPPASFLLCVPNDLVWWIPFGLYLRDGTRAGRDRTASPTGRHLLRDGAECLRAEGASPREGDGAAERDGGRRASLEKSGEPSRGRRADGRREVAAPEVRGEDPGREEEGERKGEERDEEERR